MGRKARGKARERTATTPVTASQRPRVVERSFDPAPGSVRALPCLLWIALLWIATVAAYYGSLGTPFLLDDPINITKSTQIQLPLRLGALLMDPRALVTVSLHLNYVLGGFSVAGYHVLNIVAHALTGTLVFLLARATLGLPIFEERFARRADALSGVVALVFLLHPMQTESVTYVIQRAEIFVSAGLVGTLLAFAAMKDGVSTRGLVALAVACVVGVYSKPSFAVAPALLAVYDLCFLSRGRPAEMIRRWPAYAVSAAAGVWTFVLTKAHGSFEADTAGFDIAGITPVDYLSAQFGVVVHYLQVALWPTHLCFDCGYRGPWPVLASALGDSVVVPVLILLVLAAGSVAAWKRFPLLPFAVFGSAVVLSPTSTFVPLADFYVEHRMYLPIALLAMALVPATGVALERIALRSDRRAAGIAGVAIAASIAVVLGFATTRRNALLSDPVAMMEDALEQAPQNERVQYNLANAYKRDGRTADAIARYEAAIRIAPNIVRSYENLGSLYSQAGRYDDALRVYLAGVKAKPDVAMAHRNVALAYLRLARPEEALASAKKSLELDPRSANGLALLGQALESLGRRSEAAQAYRDALAANPGDRGLSERLAQLESH